jgi:hypothetical protein
MSDGKLTAQAYLLGIFDHIPHVSGKPRNQVRFRRRRHLHFQHEHLGDSLAGQQAEILHVCNSVPPLMPLTKFV